ncbi:MAG: transglycosylase SLT domain-containing protein [Sphingopyxis sp.]|nr:transglycosylase SLT domain-containing protein [Sphingopyxis sp.]
MSNFPLPISAPGTRPQVAAIVADVAQRTGVDFDFLIDVARVESNFDPSAQAHTSSAHGLYQFTNQTWLATLHRHGGAHGYGWAADAIQRNSAGRYDIADPGQRAAVLALRGDPAAATSMAAMLTADNRDLLMARTGGVPDDVDLYLAHFLGAAGAVKFVNAWKDNPDQAAAPLLPEAAAANGSIFYSATGEPRSLGTIRNLFRQKLDEGGTATALTRATPPVAITEHSVARRHLPNGERATLPLLEMRPMPSKLSLAFAAETYRRLATLSAQGRAG